MKTVVGLFDELEDASNVVDDLVESGFSHEDISLIARDYEGVYAEQLEGEKIAEGAATGILGGGVIGALAGLLVGTSAFVIPGVGPVLVAGPIAAALSGAGIGAATGGVLGALVGWGIPEAEAEYYLEGLRRGGALVAVKVADSQVDKATEMFNEHDPVDIERRSAYWRETGWEGFDSEGKSFTREESATDRARYAAYTDEVDYGSFVPLFHQHYQTTYGTTGMPFTHYDPGYRYGYNLAMKDAYSDIDRWDQIKTQARQEWEAKHAPTETWDDVKDAARHAWEKVTETVDGNNGNGRKG